MPRTPGLLHAVALASVLLVQGCAGPTRARMGGVPPAAVPKAAPAPPAPPAAKAAAEPVVAAWVVPSPWVPAPLPQADVPAVVARARELLLEGQVEAARGELFQALATDASHAPALLLLRSLDEDPRRLLGPGGQRVTLRDGETLLSVATERLREPNLVWALARLNGVPVPLALRPGHTLLVPGGTAPPPPPPGPPSPGSPASVPPASVPPATVAPPAAPQPAAAVAAVIPRPAPEAARVPELRRLAQTCERRQDLCCAQRHLTDAARVDPADTSVQADQQRVRELVRAFTARVGPLACPPP